MMSSAICATIATFEPCGYITAANITEFQDKLITAVKDSKYNTYLVDMSGVEFLDSAGLMALVTAFRLAQSKSKSFNICSIAPSVKIIFELTQLDRVLNIFDSQDVFEASRQTQVVA